MTREGWLKLLRFLATAIGVGIWGASVYFSAMFFGVKNEKLVWVGILIAVAVTMLELVWRKPGMKGNTTINILAITAYAYGIITNTLGIMLAWGFNANRASELYFFSNIDSLVLATFPGIILEVLAEPLVTWGLVGDAMADLLGNTIEMINGNNKEDHDNNHGKQNNNNNQGKQNSNNQQRNNNNNNNQKRHEDRHMNDDMEDDGFTPLDDLDRPMGREARQNMGKHQQHQPDIIHSVNGGKLDKKNNNRFRG